MNGDLKGLLKKNQADIPIDREADRMKPSQNILRHFSMNRHYKWPGNWLSSILNT